MGRGPGTGIDEQAAAPNQNGQGGDPAANRNQKEEQMRARAEARRAEEEAKEKLRDEGGDAIRRLFKLIAEEEVEVSFILS